MEIMRFENVKKSFKDGSEEIEALKESSFSINKWGACCSNWAFWVRKVNHAYHDGRPTKAKFW